MARRTTKKYTFIDLFAGAGGFSEGFIQAGFEPVAHIEMDAYAAKTLETRAAYYYLKSIDRLSRYYNYLRGRISREEFINSIPEENLKGIFCKAMSGKTMSGLYKSIDKLLAAKKINNVDVVIGGPPCQAYSLVGRAQSSHMDIPMNKDPRNGLYKLYVNFLRRYKPRMFVFENVMGIMTADDGKIWESVKKRFKSAGYEIDFREQNSKDFGVLQNRRRMIIIGWRKDSGMKYPKLKKITTKAVVNNLLSDLPKLHPGESATRYSSVKINRYLKQNHIRTSKDVLTLHVSRTNSKRDIAIYKKAIILWNDRKKRLNYNSLPENLKTHNNRETFLDRFKVVEGNEHYCHTVVAHLSKDGHYFIHPDIRQHRSITVREAARIQSFPDNYYFEGPRTAQFVQVGNAVPPLMAKEIARGIARELEGARKK